MVKENTFKALFYTKNDNKEQIVETIGQTKLLHGKPFPTASQSQGLSWFEESCLHFKLEVLDGLIREVSSRQHCRLCICSYFG